MKRVFLWVQHLLGTGHLRRAATLARALAAEGFDVLLVSGGAASTVDPGGARFHQLPPLRAVDDKLKVLGHPDGRRAESAFLEARAQELVALLRSERPDIVITEQFPFGRTQMLGELVPLVEAAQALRPKPLIVSSVRDVVRDTVSPARTSQMVDLFERYFDLLLIHADPDFVGFGESFAGWQRIKDRARYTGYVVEALPRATHDAGAGEVIVSAGGGAVGGALLRAAIAARPRTSLTDRTWRLLVGANMSAEERTALKAEPGMIVEPARSDFTTLLANSALSISQGGYNTVIETLMFADRAVIVPFVTERETEQTRRAELLARRGMVQMVRERELDGATLAAAVERALAGPSIRSFPRCDADGGRKTAALLRSVA